MVENKPIIETMINTAALTLTSFGVITLTAENCPWEQFIRGMVLICFGAGLEFLKYIGRYKKLW